MPDEGPCIDIGNSRNPRSAQILVERFARAPVGVGARELPHDEAFGKYAARFYVLFVDAVISDERISHRDDLSAVGWIGEDLLIAGHCSVEDNLTHNFG